MGLIDISRFNFKGEEPHIFKNKHRERMVDFEGNVLDSKYLGEEVRNYLESIFAGKSIFINEDVLDYLVGTKVGLEIVKYALANNVKKLVDYNEESNDRYAYSLSNGSANVFGIREDNYLSLDLYSPLDVAERIRIYNDLAKYIEGKVYPMDGFPMYDLGGEIMAYTPLYGGTYYQERYQDELKLKEYKETIQTLTDEKDLFQSVSTSFDTLKEYFGIDQEILSDEPIIVPHDVLSRSLIKKTKNTRVYNTTQKI